jgi:hypothetical protein
MHGFTSHQPDTQKTQKTKNEQKNKNKVENKVFKKVKKNNRTKKQKNNNNIRMFVCFQHVPAGLRYVFTRYNEQ